MRAFTGKPENRLVFNNSPSTTPQAPRKSFEHDGAFKSMRPTAWDCVEVCTGAALHMRGRRALLRSGHLHSNGKRCATFMGWDVTVRVVSGRRWGMPRCAGPVAHACTSDACVHDAVLLPVPRGRAP